MIRRSLFAFALIACGDDGSKVLGPAAARDAGLTSTQEQRRTEAASSGTGSSGGSTTANGSNPNAFIPSANAVKCGSKTCMGQGFAAGCCADEASETCGMSFMGAGCSILAAPDERCPSVLGFVTLPSCCTADGMCGIDASMFGMPGCVELGAAASRAQMTRASAFPTPRACDAEASTDIDAGSDADGGVR